MSGVARLCRKRTVGRGTLCYDPTMDPRRAIVWFAVIVAVTGCTPAAQEVSGPEVLANLTSDPLDCMVYRGSDSTYYYFDRAQFKTTTRFKVRKEEIVLPANAEVDKIPIGMKLANSTTQPALQ